MTQDAGEAPLQNCVFFYPYMTIKLNKSVAEKLSEELIEWLQVDENYLVKKFFIEKKIPFNSFKEYLTNESVKGNYELALDIQEIKLIEMLADKKNATTGIQAMLKHIAGWRDDKATQINNEIKFDKDTLDKLSNRYFPPSGSKNE